MLIISQATVSSAETENVRPLLGIHSEISANGGGKIKRMWPRTSQRPLHSEGPREVYGIDGMQGDPGKEDRAVHGRQEENTIVDTGEGLENNIGSGRKSICRNTSKAVSCDLRGNEIMALKTWSIFSLKLRDLNSVLWVTAWG